MTDVIRVFVGASPAETVPLKVLEYSIKEHTGSPVDVSFMSDLAYPLPRDARNQPGTNFSFYRFMIPELAGYQGRALYLDSDMVVFKDMLELWRIPFDGAQVLTVLTPEGRPTTNHSVLLIDCGAVTWKIAEIVRGLDEGRYDYDELMRELCIVPRDRMQARIPHTWNSLDHYEPGTTALLHYTALHSQPWTGTRHPFAKVWIETLFRAVDNGALDRAALEAEVAAGSVRPSLLHQLDSRMADPASLPNDVLRRDAGFRPPYQRLAKNRLTQRLKRKVRLLAGQVWRRRA